MERDIIYDPYYYQNRREGTSQALLLDKLDIEVHHMVERSYSEQQRFIDLRPVAYYYCLKHGPPNRFVSYLAMTYYDRFLSRNTDIPVVIQGEGFERNLELFVFACIVYATRLVDPQQFNFDVLVDDHKVFNADDVANMGDLIWNGLEGEVTTPPTAFDPLIFKSLISLLEMDDRQEWELSYYVQEILFTINEDIRFTRFRPSILAASVILVACYRLHPTLYPSFSRKIFKSGYVQEVIDPTPDYRQSFRKSILFSKLQECFEELKDHVMIDYIFCRYDRYVFSKLHLVLVGNEKRKQLLINDDPPTPYRYTPKVNDHPLEFVLEDHENFIDQFRLEQQNQEQEDRSENREEDEVAAEITRE